MNTRVRLGPLVFKVSVDEYTSKVRITIFKVSVDEYTSKVRITIFKVSVDEYTSKVQDHWYLRCL